MSSISSILVFIAFTNIFSFLNAIELPHNYTLPKNSSNICFAAQFDLLLNVEYLKFDEKTNISRILLNNQTFRAYDGSCLSSDHSLILTMLDGLTTISFSFSRNEKNQTFLKQISATITINNNTDFFPNHAKSVEGPTVFTADESLFIVEQTASYRCNSKTTIDNFQTKRNVTILSIDLENLRLQPFIDPSVPFTNFATEKVCPMDIWKSSNIVPIIVGICLGILVIIVLVAYLIGRRRSHNGYQSV